MDADVQVTVNASHATVTSPSGFNRTVELDPLTIATLHHLASNSPIPTGRASQPTYHTLNTITSQPHSNPLFLKMTTRALTAYSNTSQLLTTGDPPQGNFDVKELLGDMYPHVYSELQQVQIESKGLPAALKSSKKALNQQGSSKIPNPSSTRSVFMNLDMAARHHNGNLKDINLENMSPRDIAELATTGVLNDSRIKTTTDLTRAFLHAIASEKMATKRDHFVRADPSGKSRAPMLFSHPNFNVDDNYVSGVGVTVTNDRLDFTLFLEPTATLTWLERARSETRDSQKRKGLKKDMGRPFKIIYPSDASLYKQREYPKPSKPTLFSPEDGADYIQDLLAALKSRRSLLWYLYSLARTWPVMRAVMMQIGSTIMRQRIPFLAVGSIELGTVLESLVTLGTRMANDTPTTPPKEAASITGDKAKSALALVICSMPSEEAEQMISEFVFSRLKAGSTRVRALLPNDDEGDPEPGDDEDSDDEEALGDDSKDKEEAEVARAEGLQRQEEVLADETLVKSARVVVEGVIDGTTADRASPMVVVIDFLTEDLEPHLQASVVGLSSASLEHLQLKQHLLRKLSVLVTTQVMDERRLTGVIVAHGNAVHQVHTRQWRDQRLGMTAPARNVPSFRVMTNDESYGSILGLAWNGPTASDRGTVNRQAQHIILSLQRGLVLPEVLRQSEKKLPFLTKTLWKKVLTQELRLPPTQGPVLHPSSSASTEARTTIRSVLTDALALPASYQDHDQDFNHVCNTIVARLISQVKTSIDVLTQVDGSDGKKYLRALPRRAPPALSHTLANIKSLQELFIQTKRWMTTSLPLYPNTIVAIIRTTCKLNGSAGQVLAELSLVTPQATQRLAAALTKELQTRFASYVGDAITAALVKMQTIATATLVQAASVRITSGTWPWGLEDQLPARLKPPQPFVDHLARQLSKSGTDASRAAVVAQSVSELVYSIAPTFSLVPKTCKNAMDLLESTVARKSVIKVIDSTLAILLAALQCNHDELGTSYPEVTRSGAMIRSIADAPEHLLQTVNLRGSTLTIPLQICSSLWQEEDDGSLTRPLLHSSSKRIQGAFSAANTASVKSRPRDYGVLHLALALDSNGFISVDPNMRSVEATLLDPRSILTRALGLPHRKGPICARCSDDRPSASSSLVPCAVCLRPLSASIGAPRFWMSPSSSDSKATKRALWASSITHRVGTDLGASKAMRVGSANSTSNLPQAQQDLLSLVMAGVKSIGTSSFAAPAIEAATKGDKLTAKQTRQLQAASSALDILEAKGPQAIVDAVKLVSNRPATAKNFVTKAGITRRRQRIRSRWEACFGHKALSPIIWGDGHCKKGSAGRGVTYGNIQALNALADSSRALMVGEGGSSSRCSKCFTILGNPGDRLGTTAGGRDSIRDTEAMTGGLEDLQGYKLRLCPSCGLAAARDRGSTLALGLIYLVMMIHGRKLFGSNTATEKLRESDEGEPWWVAVDGATMSRQRATDGAGVDEGDGAKTHAAGDNGAGVGWDLHDDGHDGHDGHDDGATPDDDDARASDFGADDGPGADASGEPGGGDPPWTDDGPGGDAVEGMDWMPTQEPSAEIGLGSKRPLDGARDADSHQRDGVKRQRRRSPRPGHAGEEEEEEAGFIYATARTLFNIAHSKMSALMSWFWSSWPVESYSK